MKSLKRWIALLVVFTMVAGLGIHQFGNSLKANEADVEEPTTEAQSTEEAAVPEDPAAEGPEASQDQDALVSEVENEGDAEKAEYTITIKEPETDGGSIFAWTDGSKEKVKFTGGEYAKTAEEGTTFHMEIKAKGNYEVSKVTDGSGNAVAASSVSGSTYSYEMADIAADQQINITYSKAAKAADKKDSSSDSKKEEAAADDDEESEPASAKAADTVLTTTVGSTVITVTAPAGALPEGAYVKAFKADSFIVEKTMKDAAEAEGKELVDYAAFNITIYDKDGVEIQPDDTVKVMISGVMVQGGEKNIYHITSEGAEKVDGTATGSTAVFNAEHFSIYVVTGSDETNVTNKTIPIDVYETVTLRCDKNHNHNWTAQNNNGNIQIFGNKNSNTVSVIGIKATGGQSVTVTCGNTTVKIRVKSISNNNVDALYFYTLIPGKNANSTENADKVWNGMGVGTISGVGKASSYDVNDVINGGTIKEPASFPDIKVNGKNYQYAAKGSANENSEGYYTIDWIRTVVSDGANAGNNGYNSTVNNGTNTFHRDGVVVINETNLYTVNFKVKEPEAEDFVIYDAEKYSKLVAHGTAESSLARPNPEAIDGYEFDGWYTDEACTQKANFSGTIESNTNYYGVYKEVEKTYEVIYYKSFQEKEIATTDNNKYKTGDEAVVLDYDGPDHDPNTHLFLGWTTDKNLIHSNSNVVSNDDDYNTVISSENFYEPGEKIEIGNSDVKLYAIWAKKSAMPKYTVTFTAENGTLTGQTTFSNILDRTAWGDAVTVPDYEANPGYMFDGWYENGEKVTSFPDKITSNHEYVAKFKKDQSQWFEVKFTAGNNGSLSGGNKTYDEILNGTAWDTAVKTVPTPVPATGYEFDGWYENGEKVTDFPNNVTSNHEYVAKFKKGSFAYTVEYYYDGDIGSAPEGAPTGDSAKYGTTVTLEPETIPPTTTVGGDNYVLVSTNHSVEITANPDNNIINVYYEKDVIGENGEPDGIPDKYQKIVTYLVEHGSWNDGAATDITKVVTLMKNDEPSLEGTATLEAPEVGNKPDTGYKTGYSADNWNTDPATVTVNKDTTNLTFKYTYVADFSDLSAKEIEKAYDGNASTITVNGTIDGDTVEFFVGDKKVDNSFKNVGQSAKVVVKVTRGSEIWTDTVDVTITPLNVTLKSADLAKAFDGNPLTNGSTPLETETGFIEGEGAEYIFTGTQTAIGSSPNKFEYELKDNTLAENYNIFAESGRLTVTPADNPPVTPGGNPAGPVSPDTVIRTVTGAPPAVAAVLGGALDNAAATVRELITDEDGDVPLANMKGEHKCCIFHFLLMLLALIILALYTRSMKKRQKEIFELREKIDEERARRGLPPVQKK